MFMTRKSFRWWNILVPALLLVAAAAVSGCGASGGATSSGTSTGDGYSVDLTAAQADMPVSAGEGSRSTQSVVAVVRYSSDGKMVLAPDGTTVTFTCSAGGFLVENAEGRLELRGTATVTTSNGRAAAVYAAPEERAVVRIQAEARGALAWVDVNVYSGL